MLLKRLFQKKEGARRLLLVFLCFLGSIRVLDDHHFVRCHHGFPWAPRKWVSIKRCWVWVALVDVISWNLRRECIASHVLHCIGMLPCGHRCVCLEHGCGTCHVSVDWRHVMSRRHVNIGRDDGAVKIHGQVCLCRIDIVVVVVLWCGFILAVFAGVHFVGLRAERQSKKKSAKQCAFHVWAFQFTGQCTNYGFWELFSKNAVLFRN